MSSFKQQFITIDLKNLTAEANARKEHDWRYVQTLAVNKEDKSVDLIYSFMKDGCLDNVKIESVTKSDKVKSITNDYIEAFVWENEIHDLFGINFDGIAIDFKGNFYTLSKDNPMSGVGPEAMERKQKQAKIKAALAAKKQKEKQSKPKEENTIEDKKEDE